MIARNKGDFLYNLHNELHRIGIDDDEDIAADFEEHFRASAEQGESEEETCEKLGDVREIARNYLDIKSTQINSMVEGAIANQKRISLTKPSTDRSAGFSLVKSDPQPSAREYTPVHIMDEAESLPPERAGTASGRIPEYSEAAREYTPEHIAAEQPAQGSSIPKMTDERYQNSSGSRKSEVPPQCVPPVGNNAKDGGFKFSDLKEMKPNVDAKRLIGCILLDVLLWVWLIPFVCSLIFGGLGSTALSLFVAGFAQLFGSTLYTVSKIFLCTGLVSASILLLCAMVALFKLVIHWIKHIVIMHIKAIYSI